MGCDEHEGERPNRQGWSGLRRLIGRGEAPIDTPRRAMGHLLGHGGPADRRPRLPGSGISANLADKARKLGIPVWKFGTSRA